MIYFVDNLSRTNCQLFISKQCSKTDREILLKRSIIEPKLRVAINGDKCVYNFVIKMRANASNF